MDLSEIIAIIKPHKIIADHNILVVGNDKPLKLLTRVL